MIRRLAAADCPAVRELLAESGNFNATEAAIAEELMGIAVGPNPQSDYHAFVYLGNGGAAVAGFLVLGPVPATAGSWHLYWIAVHPRLHGSGASAELHQSAEAFVRERGGYWLLAETSGLPGYARARGFYQKHGYTPLVQIPDYYRPADDMVLYGKRLDAAPGQPGA
jgi:ribosomal protein S18 acetylase RimI-like enzyme